MRFGLPGSAHSRWTIVTLLALAAAIVWRSQLIAVAGRDDRPRALETSDATSATAFDVVLPIVPVGLAHLRPGERVLVLHYWAPWERHGTRQLRALDSLARALDPARIEITIVGFDPFPSVARYVARQRIRTRVVLDRGHALRRALPCPRVPYTYVLDRRGVVRVAQAGEVQWLAPATRRLLEEIAGSSSAGPDSAGDDKLRQRVSSTPARLMRS